MTQRLVKYERGDFAVLWEEMAAAHSVRVDLEVTAEVRAVARYSGTELKRRVRRAQRLSSTAIYGKASKSLAQSSTFDPTYDSMQKKMRDLHIAPRYPVSIIPNRDLPPKPSISPQFLHAALFFHGCRRCRDRT